MNKQLVWQMSDGGKATANPNEKLDCVVRALAIAKDIPYYEAHKIAKSYGRMDRHRFPGLNTLRMMREQLRPVTEPLTRLTLNQFIKAHAIGAFFLRMRGHVFVVKNGTIFDTQPIGKRTRIHSYAETISTKGAK